MILKSFNYRGRDCYVQCELSDNTDEELQFERIPSSVMPLIKNLLNKLWKSVGSLLPRGALSGCHSLLKSSSLACDDYFFPGQRKLQKP